MEFLSSKIAISSQNTFLSRDISQELRTNKQKRDKLDRKLLLINVRPVLCVHIYRVPTLILGLLKNHISIQ